MSEKGFRTLCEIVAEEVGVEVTFYDEDTDRVDQFEDDGTLHVQEGKLRACFDVSNGQDDSGSEQNEKTEKVMKALSLPVSSRVLVEVDEDDDYEDDEYDYDDDDEEEED